MSDRTPAETCDARAAADFLRALAHPMRLRILCRLLEGELPVHGFEAELGLRQPSLSQQLAQLREAGLVVTRREAKSVFYRLADDRVSTVLAALRTVFGTGGGQRTQAEQAHPAARVESQSDPMAASPSPDRRGSPDAAAAFGTSGASVSPAGLPVLAGPATASRQAVDPRATAGCGVFAVAGWFAAAPAEQTHD
jgi:DNA-binding transcriptional ArsR family regulator